jgi:hypothetical protein
MPETNKRKYKRRFKFSEKNEKGDEMSTRCNIGIYEEKEEKLENPDVILYKHSDGYPEGTLPLLKKFMENPKNDRNRYDYEYQSAWLLHTLINQGIEDSITFGYETIHVGYGICKEIHGDIEYYYAIYPDRIETYKAGFDQEFKDFELIEKTKV